jgi:hypothetical protein
MNPEDDSPSHPSKARPAPPKSGRPAPPKSGRPAPPKSGRPAPPKSGRPAPPKSGHPAPPTNADVSSSDPQKNSQDIENTTMDKAQDLEERGEYSEAAILYRSLGLTNDENRCLQLALSKSQNEKTTIIHNGDKIIRDSVIMKDEN